MIFELDLNGIGNLILQNRIKVGKLIHFEFQTMYKRVIDDRTRVFLSFTLANRVH